MADLTKKNFSSRQRRDATGKNFPQTTELEPKDPRDHPFGSKNNNVAISMNSDALPPIETG